MQRMWWCMVKRGKHICREPNSPGADAKQLPDIVIPGLQHQSESASHAPSPSKQLITPTGILESALKLYDMDVDCDFLKPSHEGMEVNSAQPNIIAGSLHIAVVSPNKIPAQDILEISTPQLPPKRIRAEK